MTTIDYHQTAEGIHVLEVQERHIGDFSSQSVTDMLSQIHYNAYGKPAYILVNLEAHYRLPLREFVMELKQFYQAVNGNKLTIALVVQPSMIKVLEAVVKTLVTREFIQYFTLPERAYLWLNMERKRNNAA